MESCRIYYFNIFSWNKTKQIYGFYLKYIFVLIQSPIILSVPV